MEFQRDINLLEVPRFNVSRFHPRRFGLSYLDFLELSASAFCSFITEQAPMHVSLRGKGNFFYFSVIITSLQKTLFWLLKAH